MCKDNSFEVKASELEELTFYGGTTAIIVRAVDVLFHRIADVFRGDLHANAVRPDAIRLVQQIRVFTVLVGDVKAVCVDETAKGGTVAGRFDAMSNRLKGFRHGFR